MKKKKAATKVDASFETYETYETPIVMKFCGQTIRELQSTSTEEARKIVDRSTRYFRERRKSSCTHSAI